LPKSKFSRKTNHVVTHTEVDKAKTAFTPPVMKIAEGIQVRGLRWKKQLSDNFFREAGTGATPQAPQLSAKKKKYNPMPCAIRGARRFHNGKNKRLHQDV
jgi:hypothetical protein